MPHRVLIVDNDQAVLTRNRSILENMGYLVTASSSFPEARRRLLFAPPDLLMADLRLGEYNGLHLVHLAHRGSAVESRMPAIITDVVADHALEAEAGRADACYMLKPLEPSMLVNTVRRLLDGRPMDPATEAARRWPRKRAGINARLDKTDVRVADVSYGGLLLEVPHAEGGQLRGVAHINIASLGSIPVRLVWSRKSAVGPEWCGLEVLAGVDQPAAAQWRGYVDSFSGACFAEL